MRATSAHLTRTLEMADATRRIVALVAAAVAIRLVVMPFTLHFDAYQIYSRAHEAAYHDEWFSFSSQIIIQTLHNAWLFLMRPLLPGSEQIWSHSASTLGVGASQEDYDRFLAYDHLYRTIFLLKLPYVVADLTCAWVLTRLVTPARRFAVAAFWLLNPLVIFSSAIYGRHDSVAILLVLLSLLAARRATDGWRVAGLALLGVATLMRFFPVLLVAPFLLAFRRTNRQLVLFLGLLAAMVAAVELAGWAVSGTSTILTILDSYEHFRYWFDAGLYLRFDDFIVLFPLAYTLGLFWTIERGVTPEEYPTFGALAFLLLFSVTFFHPHYAVWLVPFLALTITGSRRMLVYHAIQIVCILVYTVQWGSWTTWDLLKPVLGGRTASLPDPVEAIQAQIEPRIFFGLFRSILTATCLWMGWKLLTALPERGNPHPPARGNPLPPAGENPHPPSPSSRCAGERVPVASVVSPFSASASEHVEENSPIPHEAPPLPRTGMRGTGGEGSPRLGAEGSPAREARTLPVGGTILLLPLLFTGCSAVVAGYSSPLAHDYGAVAWSVLGGPVEQVFVAGPGTSAAIDNDGTTTPEEFQQRLAALPEDARAGRLDELRIGLRLADDAGFRWATGARLHLLDRDGATLLDVAVDDQPHEDDWLRLEDPPDVSSGEPLRLRLLPGDGPDAGRLEFGLTSDRAPFGGWRATTLAADGTPVELNGALLVWTRYERDFDADGVLHAAAARLREGAEQDLGFAFFWLAGLAAIPLAAAWFTRRQRRVEG